MAKNELRLIITADGKRAIDTIDATERNIKALASQTLQLEKDLKAGAARASDMDHAFSLLKDAIVRNVASIKLLNPSLNETEEYLKKWNLVMSTIGTKGGAAFSETLGRIKAEVNELNRVLMESSTVEYSAVSDVDGNLIAKKQLEEEWVAAKKKHEEDILSIEKISQEESYRQYKQTVEAKKAEDEAYYKSIEENIRKQEALYKSITAMMKEQAAYEESMQKKAFSWSTGKGPQNAMGDSYKGSPETYEQTWQRLLQEQDRQLEADWIAAKKIHEQEKIQIEKAANKESLALYKDMMKKKKEELNEEIKWIEAGINHKKQFEKGSQNTVKNVDKISRSISNLSKNTKASAGYFSKLFDTTKNVLMFRSIMKIINSIASLTKFLGDSVQAAAEAEQVFSKLNTVFVGTGGAMEKAISLASQIGVATSTAASALSTVGDLLQAQGQTTIQSLETASEWVSQFQDIIAFKDINMSLEEFAQNFMSGAAGNLRNFRTFGSIVRESAVNAELAKKGLDKLTGSELELAKMTTRAEMALAQQKNALGATQREWDTMLSVQRRYEEQLKIFKENVGENINPVVKMWTELKTVMLEVFNAQKTWQEKYKMVEEKKAIDTKYYTFDANGEIANQSNYLGLKNALDNANIMYGNGGEDSQSKAINSAILAMQEYGASITQITQLFEEMQTGGMGVAGDFREAFLVAAEEYIAGLLEIEKESENVDKIIKESSFVDSMLEQIQQLGGISFAGSELYKTFTDELDKALNGEIDVNKLEETLGNVKKYLLDSVFKPIEETELKGVELVFSDDAELDRLNKIKDTYEALYSIIYSAGDEYSNYLELIETYWNDNNKKIEDHNAQLEAQKKLISDIESVNNKTADYEKQLRQIDMSDTEKVLDNLNEMLEAATDENLKIAIEAQIVAFNNLTKATDERTRKEELEAKREEISKSASAYLQSAADYRKQAEQLGMSEYEIAMQNYDEEFFRLQDEYNAASDELKDSIREQIMAMFDERLAYIQLTEATEAYNQEQQNKQTWEDLKSQFSDSFGEFGTLVSAFSSGGFSDLLSTLIKIIAQTEVASKLGSLLSDSILPTLNAFLEPLLPVISMLSESIRMLVDIVLRPLFPLLQGLASTIAITVGIFNTAIGLISDGIKKTVGIVVQSIENMINWVIDLVNEIPFVDVGHVRIGASDWANIDVEANMMANIEKIGVVLEQIAEYDMSTSENTEKMASKDYDTYKKLLAAKEIDEATYNRWTGMDKYSTSFAANGVSYTTGSKQSYVSVNNLTVQVPSGMTLVEFLKGLEDYNNGNSLYAVNTMAV